LHSTWSSNQKKQKKKPKQQANEEQKEKGLSRGAGNVAQLMNNFKPQPKKPERTSKFIVHSFFFAPTQKLYLTSTSWLFRNGESEKRAQMMALSSSALNSGIKPG